MDIQTQNRSRSYRVEPFPDYPECFVEVQQLKEPESNQILDRRGVSLRSAKASAVSLVKRDVMLRSVITFGGFKKDGVTIEPDDAEAKAWLFLEQEFEDEDANIVTLWDIVVRKWTEQTRGELKNSLRPSPGSSAGASQKTSS